MNYIYKHDARTSKTTKDTMSTYSNFYLVQFVKANEHVILNLANVFSSLAISVTNRKGNNSKNTTVISAKKNGKPTAGYLETSVTSQNIFTSFSPLNDTFFKRLCSVQHAEIISGLLRKSKHMFPVR